MRTALMVVVLTWTAAARAQTYPPIEDREFSLDMYSGAALGSVQIVGMGGAALGFAEGSAGALFNPAAAAVRRTTSKGSWDWDFHLDALNGSLASDFDNNGVRGTEDSGTSLETAGLAGMIHGTGVAITGTTQTTTFDGVATDEQLQARVLTGKIALAHELLDRTWTVGVGLRIGTFSLDTLATGAPTTLFSLSGVGLEAGGLWRPPRGNLRVGASASLPVSGRDVDVILEGCDPLDCNGYILPGRVVAPWQVAAGIAWRRAPTWWNQQVSTYYRDEPALLLAADVVVSGGVVDGLGIEKWGAQEAQPSGAHPSVSVRAGVEYEVLPARLRLRAGSYWEPSRFEDVGGRIHATAGAEVSVFELRMWSWMFRTKLALTADVAPRYVNAGISVGLWH